MASDAALPIVKAVATIACWAIREVVARMASTLLRTISSAYSAAASVTIGLGGLTTAGCSTVEGTDAC